MGRVCKIYLSETYPVPNKIVRERVESLNCEFNRKSDAFRNIAFNNEKDGSNVVKNLFYYNFCTRIQRFA